MNILKHMEAVFVATLVLTVSASYALDTLPEAVASPALSASTVPVVTVSARRMTPDEKAQSLRDEQKAAGKHAGRA